MSDYKTAYEKVQELQKSKDEWNPNLGTWIDWFKGFDPSFHKYYVYNGKKKIYKSMFTLKMAKQVCEDWASLLMNEKVQIVVADQDKLDKLLVDLDFWTKSNEAVEKGFALSMCALVIDINGLEVEMNDETGEGILKSTSKAYLTLTEHTASHLIPITWENGRCTECAFVYDSSKTKTTCIHFLNEDGTYDIFKQIEDKNNQSKNKAYVFHTNSKTPWFVLIHPRTTNNIDIDSPLPISIFANSIDTLKSIDTKYDSYNIEFQQGKKRTYVSADFSVINKENGDVENTFDPNDTVIYQLPATVGIDGKEKNLIVNVTDALRAAEHSQALQDELNYLSKQVGLGVDYYRFEKGRVMTATQVISEKSDTFRNMRKHETILEAALITLIQSIMFASTSFTNLKFSKIDQVEIHFDDSIIEDKNTEKDADRKDMEAGIMSKLEFRMKWYGEDEETAKKAMEKSFGDPELLSRINAYGPALAMGTISTEEFVNQVYKDYDDTKKAEIVEELKAQGKITEEDLNLYDPNQKKPTNEEK